MIIASEGEKKEFVKISAGTVQACCYDVWDIGLQEVKSPEGIKIQHKVIIGWEVNELMTEGKHQGKRMVISRRYTLSLHEKATLRKDLEAWRGKAFTPEELKGFDIEKLIAVNCMLSIVHSEDGKYANVGSVSKLMKGLEVMKPENSRSIPEWIQKLKDKAILPTEDIQDQDNPKGIDGEEIPF